VIDLSEVVGGMLRLIEIFKSFFCNHGSTERITCTKLAFNPEVAERLNEF